MPTTYSEIIRTICTTRSSGGKPSPDLCLLPSTEPLEPREDGRPRQEAFEVPAAMIPDDTAPFHLPADERFLEEAAINRIVYRPFNLKAGAVAQVESSLAP